MHLIKSTAWGKSVILILAVLVALVLVLSSAPREVMAQEGKGGTTTEQTAGEQSGQEAHVRLAHLSPDAPPVDVYLNGEPVEPLTNVSLKTITNYLPVPAGTQNVEIYAAGTQELLFESDIDFEGGATYTHGIIGISEDGSLKAPLYEDDLSPAKDEGEAKLRVIHAVSDVGAVRVSMDFEGGENLFLLPEFSNASDYEAVPAREHEPKVIAATTGQQLELRVPEATLEKGEVYTAFVVGRAEYRTPEVILASDSSGKGVESVDGQAMGPGGGVITGSGTEEPLPSSSGPMLPLAFILLGGTLLCVGVPVVIRGYRKGHERDVSA